MSTVQNVAASWTSVNETAWDIRTPVHVASTFYDLKGFLSGGCTLHTPERELVPDPAGARLLHLQCHFGLDTLSWARRGASATGVDFSAVAIDEGRRLAAETRLPVEFIKADVQALPRSLDRRFDVIVSTYGVLPWLHDLDGWARGIRCALAPGGSFVLVEFHPILEILHPGSVSGVGGYFMPRPPKEQWSTGTYTDPQAAIAYREYRWQHPVGDVMTALLGADLAVTSFREYPYCSFPLVPGLQRRDDGEWAPEGTATSPYLYSIVCRCSEDR